MICPNCGTKLDDNAKECFLCGCNIEQEQNTPDETPNFETNVCSVCGNKLDKQDTTCPICGVCIESPMGFDEKNNDNKNNGKKQSEKKSFEKEKSKSNLKKIIIIVASLITVITVGITTLLLLNKNDASNNKNSASQTEAAATKAPSEATQAQTETVTPATVTPTAPQTVPATVAPAADDLIKTDYFTLTIPASWEGKYGYHIYETEGYGYGVRIYHLKNQSDNYGEHLFSIALMADLDNFNYLPDAEYLGELDVYRINLFYVCAIFPTDIQYTAETADEYLAMYDDIGEILDSFKQCGESVFTPSKSKEPPVTQNTFEPYFEPYIIKVKSGSLSIYDSPSYSANIVGEITDKGSYTIVEEYVEPEQGAAFCTWGKLKSGVGWINLYDASIAS